MLSLICCRLCPMVPGKPLGSAISLKNTASTAVSSLVLMNPCRAITSGNNTMLYYRNGSFTVELKMRCPTHFTTYSLGTGSVSVYTDFNKFKAGEKSLTRHPIPTFCRKWMSFIKTSQGEWEKTTVKFFLSRHPPSLEVDWLTQWNQHKHGSHWSHKQKYLGGFSGTALWNTNTCIYNVTNWWEHFTIAFLNQNNMRWPDPSNSMLSHSDPA